MLYLLDANVLIDAQRDYYPIDRVPQFWEWLVNVSDHGQVKIPIEIFEEVKDGKDALADWMRESNNKNALMLDEDVDVNLLQRTINEGYAPDLTDVESIKIGRDPFLIAYALAAPDQRVIVTTENSKPKQQRANRHLPDVCQTMGIKCINSFELLRRLDFRTSWNKPN